MSETDGPKRGRKKKSDEAEKGPAIDSEIPREAEEPAAPAEPEPVRNPWLLPGSDEGQRRSASIDDIFRSRRPAIGAGPASVRPANGNWVVWALLGVTTAWLVSTSLHVLAQGERAVVTTFGRYSGTIGPGLHFTLPWPAQQIVRREVGKDQTLLLPDKEAETLMPTRDSELIDVRAQVRWRVSDLRQFTFAVPDGEAYLRRLADAAIRGAVAEMSFDELRGGKRQAELQQRIAGRLQRTLEAAHAGVMIVGVEVTDTKPPARLAETFKKIDSATDEARKNHDRAVAWAAQTRYAAQAEAAAFDRAYANYKLAPGVWRTRMYYETMEKVLTNNPVVLGGSGSVVQPGDGAKPAATAAAQQGGQ